VTVFHYTYSHRIDKILASGMLLPPRQVDGSSEMTTAYLAKLRTPKRHIARVKADERLLMFSSNSAWEPASFRGVKEADGTVVDLFNIEEYAERGEAIYRIAVDTAECRLKPWATARKLWLSTVVAHNLETFARKLGSDPFQWWATTAPVRAEMFLSVETLERSKWVELIETREER
jgi:hypothetical protein